MSRAGYLDCLECPKCGARHDAGELHNLCACGSPLLAVYDLKRLAASLQPGDLTGRPTNMWRYREFLPVADARHIVSLGEGSRGHPLPDAAGPAAG